LEVPTGVVADRFGRKYSLALGALIISLATLIYGSVPDFLVFLVGEFLFATGVALISGADRALLYDALKEAGREKDSKSVFGRANSIHLLAMFLSAPVGSLIASKLGLNYPMLLSFVPYLLAALVAWSISEPSVRGQVSESKRYWDIARNGFNYFRHHPQLRILALDSVLVASGAYFVIWLYQPLLTSFNVPIIYFGYIHAFLIGVEILVSANFVRLEKWLGSGAAYFRATALVTALAFTLPVVLPGVVSVIVLVVFAGGFGLTRAELMSSYLNRHIPSTERATILSFVSMLRRLALVLLNPLIGVTADSSLKFALLLVALLPLSAFLFSPLKQKMLD
jgi:MFS family permease